MLWYLASSFASSSRNSASACHHHASVCRTELENPFEVEVEVEFCDGVEFESEADCTLEGSRADFESASVWDFDCDSCRVDHWHSRASLSVSG
eukprot:1735040-Rhodomonas_salina.1